MIRKISKHTGIGGKGVKLDMFYDVDEEIGSGGFSVVKRATEIETGKEYALKMIRNSVFKKNRERTLEEVEVLKKLDHPGIVKFKEVIQTKNHYVIAMELLKGGELFERIVSKEKYCEEDAKGIAKKILTTLKYIHENDVVHRDLKPENFLFVSEEEDSELKLTDFGFATFVEGKKKLTSACGTPEYVAPEILDEKPYGKAVDMWSAGVIIYILLCGFPPFHGDTESELFDRICEAKFEFVAPYWNDVSFESRDLITNLLQVNPRKRLTAEQALQHSWFTTQTDEVHDLSLALEELKRYKATEKFRKAILAVLAANKLKGILGGFHSD